MQKEDLKNWTCEQMKQKILSLFSSEEILKKESERMAKCITSRDKKIDTLNSENEELRKENKMLKQRIKDLEDICDGSCFANETDDRDEKIAKMQDRIDSDCVRINRLKVTINTLVDMYGLLRNQVGMD